ncbi:MAG: M48 family metalloprotease [Cyclobacteriaceae bacterium]
MKIFKPFILLSCIVATAAVTSCDKNGDFLIFSIQNDIDLGEKVAEQIASDTSFDILSPEQYPVSYDYIESMVENILESEDITYKEEFNWRINIINDPADAPILNAFATPGGQLYVHTGLIYFLDKEDDLAGVIGHEIAHSDQRHGSKQLQRQYGISILLSIISGGEASNLAQIAGQIAGTGAVLAFSRDAESEADDFSVRYLATTNYACNGAAAFFKKLLDNEAARQPEFLSTHPSPENRVEDINARAADLNCDTTIDENSAQRYVNFRNSLP